MGAAEKYWGQRSRLKWLKWGDKNSKFFQGTTIQRSDENKTQRLKNLSGDWVEGQEEVTEAVMEHFQQLYNSNSEALMLIKRSIDETFVNAISHSHNNAKAFFFSYWGRCKIFGKCEVG